MRIVRQRGLRHVRNLTASRIGDVSRLPRIGITVGDPAGIGPEIAIKAARDAAVRDVCEPVVYGPNTDADRARFAPGILSADAGRAAYDAIVAAVSDARSGVIDAIATAPLNKEALALAGFRWKGHTELLAHLTDTPRVAMMFYADALRVVLATIHVPLADVPGLMTRDLIEFTIDLTARELPRFGFHAPRLALAGVNPHAGEHGVIGREDDEVLTPSVAACRAPRHRRDGPLAGRHDLRARGPRRVRRRDRVLSRSGVDSDQAVGVRPGRERDAGSADHSHLRRPWDGLRHRGPRDGRSLQPRRSRPARGASGSGEDPRVTKTEREQAQKIIADNRKAHHDYHLLETFEAGVALMGTEVKSIREGGANLRDSFARIEGGEVWIYNVHISAYRNRGYADHEPTRRRKLLLHRREIRKLIGKTVERGMTLVPVRMYLKNGRVKVAISLAKGKKAHDKRETIKRRETDRETRAAIKERR